MGSFISDKSFINENIFKYEERLESQYSIFLEETPTFTTYYHINTVQSITDTGLLNVEEIIGNKSPIKFNKINDFPIYGISNIQLDLSEEEEGLTTSYEGEGTILPNTVEPLPNDFFTISYLSKTYIFMITSISYDTIKSNNFYKISFTLKTMSDKDLGYLEKQSSEIYNCIFKNIGTEDNCLIEKDVYDQVLSLKTVCNNLIDRYITLFYSAKFNSFLFDNGGSYIYDKYATHFINSNSLFSNENGYNTIILSNEDDSMGFIGEYEDCIYRIIETRNVEELDYTRYLTNRIVNVNSIFRYYSLNNVQSVMFTDTGLSEYLDDKLIDDTRSNIKAIGDMSIRDKLFIGYFNNSIENVYGLDVDAIKSIKIRYDLNSFRYIPILIFILKYYIMRFIRV